MDRDEGIGWAVDLDRLGRHAEEFDSPAECTARFKEIQALLSPAGGYTASVARLSPREGVRGYVVAVVWPGGGQDGPPLGRTGRPVELPEHVWVVLAFEAYRAELGRSAWNA